MRILHLLKTSAGASWAFRQMRELVGSKLDVHVALPPGGPMVARCRDAGIAVHLGQFDFPARRPWTWPGCCRDLKRLVRQVKPDIIHSHFVGTTLTMRLGLGRWHPIPRIFQVPGPLHLEHPPFRHIEIATAGPMDHWIGSCKWTCERYRRCGVPRDRIYLSYYGIDIRQFGDIRGRLRQELGFDKSARLVGMVAYMYAPKRYLGQWRGLKGHEDLVDAIAICLRADPSIRGVFIGGAWDGATSYERRVRAYGERHCGDRAVFLGTRDDVPELYPDLDVAVHPSHSENLGGAGESLLAGVPTVATNVGGFPDLLKPGRTGWLVPPRDPVGLAGAIMDALTNNARSRAMALEGRTLARRLLDVKRTARQVMGIYHAILS